MRKFLLGAGGARDRRGRVRARGRHLDRADRRRHDRAGPRRRRELRRAIRHARERRHPDDRHGQPGVPAWWYGGKSVDGLRRESAPSPATPTWSRATRARSRMRSPSELGFDEAPVELGRHPVQQVLRARAEGLRLRHAADLDHREAGRSRRLQRRLLRRESGTHRERRVTRDRRDGTGRAAGPRSSARRSAPPASTVIEELVQPTDGAVVYDDLDLAPQGSEERSDRRRRRRLSHGLLSATRTWSSVSSRPRRAGALRAHVREGQSAGRVREPRRSRRSRKTARSTR